MDSDPEYERPIKEMVGEMGSAMVGLHLTVHSSELTIAKNWLTWERAVSLKSLRSQVSKHQNIENNRPD